MFEIKN